MSKYGLSDEVIGSIIKCGENNQIEHIILFGSRARGDYKSRSDIDLAISGGNAERFMLDIEEYVPTLLKFDIVNMDKPIQSELMVSIRKEGVVVYEKV